MNHLNVYIRIILNVLVVLVIIYLVVNLFVYLLPIILILIGIYYLYRIYLELKNKYQKDKTSSKKEKGIIDAEIINEKFDK